MNLIGVVNPKNVVGEALLKSFSDLPGAEAFAMTVNSFDIEDFEDLIRTKLKEDNIFIFNSKFTDELKEVDINYADRVCAELGDLFRAIKKLTNLLLREGKKGKFIFITTNPSISHSSSFPISPIYDGAVHSLVRSLAKEFKSTQLIFHGVCIEPVCEMINESELRDYQRRMKVYAMRKRPIRLEALADFIKNVALTNLGLSSGSIFYIGEGLDQLNF